MFQSKKEVLTLSVNILSVAEVKGYTGEVVLIRFSAHADCELFKGSTAEEGVDTQVQYAQKQKSLSARYVLSGTDYTGSSCRIFIENNALVRDDEPIQTVPKIITDSKALAWLETAELTGEIESTQEALMIHVYTNQDGRD